MSQLIEFWSKLENVERASAEDIQRDALAYLHEIDRLREENEQLKDKSDQAFKIMMSATSDNERLRQYIERLESQLGDAYGTLLQIGIMCSNEQTAQILRILSVTQRAIQRIKGEGTE